MKRCYYGGNNCEIDKQYAEIIREYIFGEYEFENIYKFLLQNILDSEKN